jgi:hypothetical protein
MDIKKMNNQDVPSMGAAIPWRYYFKWYGSKNNQVQAVADSIAGTERCINTDDGSIDWTVSSASVCVDGGGAWDVPKACFLAQPLRLTDEQVQTIQSGYPNPNPVQESAIKTLINSDIGVGETYLIIPFEGCGGDGNKDKDIADVANSCFGNAGNHTLEALDGDFENLGSVPQCGGMHALYDGGKWDWTVGVYDEFKEFSAPLGLDPTNGYDGTSAIKGVHLNWCSGANMHFDIGMDTPMWESEENAGSIRQTNAASNIFMRYKRHVCAVPDGRDKLNIEAPPPPWSVARASSGNAKPCSGHSCADPADCRSKWGSCGKTDLYCNASSIWTSSCPTT